MPACLTKSCFESTAARRLPGHGFATACDSYYHAKRHGCKPLMHLVKLGGSILTDKSQYAVAREADIARLAGEWAGHGPGLIVHGAGSFGHTLARQHDLKRGDDGDAARRFAAARVHADVRRLGGQVVAALIAADVPALWFSAADIAVLKGGELVDMDTSAIARALDLGFVPVVSGDVVPDTTRGWGILSGDVWMASLAVAMQPALAIFATDVDGLYDRDPQQRGARFLARVGRDIVLDASSGGGSPAATRADVTGAMAGKLARARQVAKHAGRTLILNGAEPGRLAEALSGRPVIASEVEG